MEIHNPHDRFIREYLADRENAIDFLRATLPAPLREILNLNEIRRLPGSFIDEQFRELKTDMLFRVPLAGVTRSDSGSVSEQDAIEIYILFEHKSNHDPGLFQQLLGYLARIYREQESPIPVIPFVFHQVTEDYTGPFNFLELFPLKGEIRRIIKPFIPDFTIAFFNLPAADLNELVASLELRVILEIMNRIRSPDLPVQLERIFRLGRSLFYEEKGLEILRKLLLYIYGSIEIEPTDLKDIITVSVSAEKGELAMTTLERVLKQGIEKGIAEGIEQGKLEDARRMFAEGLSPELIQRITGLSEEKLQEIRDRL